jgi:flagellar protein FliS
MRLPNPRIAYSELKVRSATSLELVIMLYDMLTADLHTALAAIHDCNIELRTNELNHALHVVEQLQGTLDIDNGGPAAAQLDRFYDFARARILEAQLRSSSPILEELLVAVGTVHGAWKQIHDDQAAATQFVGATIPPPATETAHANWTA